MFGDFKREKIRPNVNIHGGLHVIKNNTTTQRKERDSRKTSCNCSVSLIDIRRDKNWLYPYIPNALMSVFVLEEFRTVLHK